MSGQGYSGNLKTCRMRGGFYSSMTGLEIPNQPDLFTRCLQYLVIMGISSDIMHEFVAKEIKGVYSSYDGWTITQRNMESGYDTIATLDRRNGGHRERVRVLVTFAKEVSPSLFTELKKTERTDDGTVTRNSFAVMVPANADTSSVPAGVNILTMRSFTFDGKELAWVKKPVRKAEDPVLKAS
jgi:hypothetical protein